MTIVRFGMTLQFESLNSEDPTNFGHLREHYRIDDPRELSALNVLAFAEMYLDGDEQRAKKPAIMNKLDREFDVLFPDE